MSPQHPSCPGTAVAHGFVVVLEEAGVVTGGLTGAERTGVRTCARSAALRRALARARAARSAAACFARVAAALRCAACWSVSVDDTVAVVCGGCANGRECGRGVPPTRTTSPTTTTAATATMSESARQPAGRLPGRRDRSTAGCSSVRVSAIAACRSEWRGTSSRLARLASAYRSNSGGGGRSPRRLSGMTRATRSESSVGGEVNVPDTPLAYTWKPWQTPTSRDKAL